MRSRRSNAVIIHEKIPRKLENYTCILLRHRTETVMRGKTCLLLSKIHEAHVGVCQFQRLRPYHLSHDAHEAIRMVDISLNVFSFIFFRMRTVLEQNALGLFGAVLTDFFCEASLKPFCFFFIDALYETKFDRPLFNRRTIKRKMSQ